MSTALRIDRIEKNYLINGGLDFFQRGGSGSSTNLSTTPSYVAADRFKMSYTGTVTGTPNTQRTATTLTSPRAKFMVQLTGQRNASALTFTMEQRIEGVEARELAYAGAASFSVWVFTPISGCSVRLTLNTPSVEDNYTSVTQLSQQTNSTTITASTWTKITFSNLTISSAANNGLAVVVDLQIPSGTDGSAQNHFMTQLMLNAGTTASDFGRNGRHIREEFDTCKRYYQQIGRGTIGFANSLATGFELALKYNPVMRTTPTVTLKASGTVTVIHYPTGGQAHVTAASPVYSSGSEDSFDGSSRGTISGFSGLSIGFAGVFEDAVVLQADAEL